MFLLDTPIVFELRKARAGGAEAGLTAWAAGKFDAERIAKTVKGTGIAEKVSHCRVIIPGHVAVLMGELEEELQGWEIKVGPREAVDLPRYLKTAR